LIDARFGMYFEETEWCVRIARAGWRLTYVPSSIVLHKIQLDRHDQSPKVTYYMARNRLLFLRLTGAPSSAWLNAMVVQDLRTWLSWRIKPKWRGRSAQRVAIQRGWRDFLRGRFGMIER
jgi:GT2 family glycosyltransferase